MQTWAPSRAPRGGDADAWTAADLIASAMLLQLLALCPTPRVQPRMDITVCSGGACTENGGDMLRDACTILAAGDAALEVKTVFCSGECPADLAMLCPSRGALEAYEAPCSTLEAAIASAEAAISAAGSKVADGLKEALAANTAAAVALAAGDFAAGAKHYSDALASAPGHLLEPFQPPIPDEPLEWAASKWDEALFKSELRLSKDPADAEGFGACGGGKSVVGGKVCPVPTLTLVDAAVDGRDVAGGWRDSDGAAGDFTLTMSANGHFFSGSLLLKLTSNLRDVHVLVFDDIDLFSNLNLTRY